MTPEKAVLEQRFSETFRWEKNKRRERILLSLACYSLLAAVLTLPFTGALRPWVNPWLVPAIFWLLGTTAILLLDRFRPFRSVRAINAIDKRLGLKERAITAWEILGRKKAEAPELLVLKEAAEKLRAFEPKRVFARKFGLEAYTLGPLFLLWFALVWFGVEFHSDHGLQPVTARRSVAQNVREFARELQARAKTEGLDETLRIARTLETAAQKRLGEETGDERFRSELAAVADKIREKPEAGAGTKNAFGRTEDELRELKTELQSARELNTGEKLADRGEDGSELFERLSGLPHLKQAIEKGWSSDTSQSKDELKTFLEKLEREVNREMDDRLLLETQHFLDEILQHQMPGGETKTAAAGQEQPQVPTEGQRQQAKTNLPGTEPGSKQGVGELPTATEIGAATHLKGLLREGSSTGVTLKGKPGEAKPTVPQEDVVASYRRRAEAELNTERVPEELKGVIRNYFLSLGMEERQK